MPNHRFFVEELTSESREISLSSGEAQHASRVLRLQEGDQCELLNGNGGIAKAEIIHCQNRDVVCRILKTKFHPDNMDSPQPRLQLYIAPPKGKNMDILLKMATELGVRRITPILCRYGVSKPDTSKESWRDTLIAACKQSGNYWLPTVDAPLDFKEAVKQISEPSDDSLHPRIHIVGAVPREGFRWAEFPQRDKLTVMKTISLWVGPEGGFSPEEEEILRKNGCAAITVGNFILRVETAVPALLGAIHQRLTE